MKDDGIDKLHSDMLDTGFWEGECLHYCSICEQFEYCKGKDCNYSSMLGRHGRCEVYAPPWNIAKLIGLLR